MDFLNDIAHAIIHHPLEIAVCIGFPVVLALMFGGGGLDFGGRGDDCDGDGDGGD